jgi:hypothetical protein
MGRVPMLALALALAGASTTAEAKPIEAVSQPSRAKSLRVEIVEVHDGKREERAFVIALEADRPSRVQTNDDGESYELVVRVVNARSREAVVELSLERSRRREGRSSHTQLDVTREVERGKTTMMTRVAQQKGHLEVRALLQ